MHGCLMHGQCDRFGAEIAMAHYKHADMHLQEAVVVHAIRPCIPPPTHPGILAFPIHSNRTSQHTALHVQGFHQDHLQTSHSPLPSRRRWILTMPSTYSSCRSNRCFQELLYQHSRMSSGRQRLEKKPHRKAAARCESAQLNFIVCLSVKGCCIQNRQKQAWLHP